MMEAEREKGSEIVLEILVIGSHSDRISKCGLRRRNQSFVAEAIVGKLKTHLHGSVQHVVHSAGSETFTMFGTSGCRNLIGWLL